jgi:ribosomal protein S27AE
MFFFYNLDRYEFLIIIVVLIILSVIFYYFSVRSRKKYKCPECGEFVNVEYMETTRCGMCGSLLKKKEE